MLRLKRARGIHRRQRLTRADKLFSLSFWGVPRISPDDYTLTIDGKVSNPLTLSLEELQSFDAIEREVALDCVGGIRNNCVMSGVSFARLLDLSQVDPAASTAVFHCADGPYFTTHPIDDLVSTEAFMAYSVNGLSSPEHGYPLRLAAPGKYGYKWAKWVVRIELVEGSPKGYWEQRGLPDRARIGDIR